jgi:hypothetical protein
MINNLYVIFIKNNEFLFSNFFLEMSFQELPVELHELIIRKALVNKGSFGLGVVCKSFHTITKNYYTICKFGEFTCRSCEIGPTLNVEAIQCLSCECISNYYSQKPKHYTKCKTLTVKYHILTTTKCRKCFGFNGEHTQNCEYFKEGVRGIKGICKKCMFRLQNRECEHCGLNFMTPYKGENAYCHRCLPEFSSLYEINPLWKEILPTEEPFNY